jgi:molybdate transport system substrate-binding protein
MLDRTLFLVLGAGLYLAAGCSRQSTPANKPGELRILCGSSMATPGQQIAKLFKEQQGVEVLVDLGGSETLLPRVLTGAPADIFLCHDPFEQKVKDAGFWAGSARVGVLKPVLLVRPGNPLGVKSVNDLTNRNLKLGIGDPRSSTCGELFVGLLEKKGLSNAVMKQVVVQARTHAELADGLIVGPLDAVVVWNYVSRFYSNKVQLVPTDDPYAEIHVTVVGLKQSQNPKARDAFLEYCRSDAVKAIFAEQGYGAMGSRTSGPSKAP